MKKILFLILPFFLFAKICSYDIKIEYEKDKIEAKAYLDFNKSIDIDITDAKIYNIKNGYIKLSDFPKYIKSKNRPIELDFIYEIKPYKNSILLFDSWYPKVEKRCFYKVEIDFKDYIPIMQYTSKKDNIFLFDKPLKNLYIIASKDFVVNKKEYKDICISTYLFKKDSNLSKKYIEKSYQYLRLYKDIFGFLPYKNFNIVEIPYPVAYSMATMSVIGEQIIDKSFVFDNSLGHEIVHQWIGNYIFPTKIGNWSEGLTTYYSDMLYAKKRGKDIEFRKDILIKYNSYINKDNEITLADFRYKDIESKNSIGYGKGSFFFYMLSNLIGKKDFDKAVKKILKKYRFKEIGFEELKEVFETVSKKDLDNFFLQWVYRKGAFDFELKNISLSFEKDRYKIDFDLISNEYDLKLPIFICSKNRCKKVYIDTKKTKHTLYSNFAPTKLIVDKDYEIFRRLKPQETPPVISKILGSKNLLVICNDKKRYKEILKDFENVKSYKNIDFKELKDKDILILGENRLLKRLAIEFKKEGLSKAEAFKNPLNIEKNIVVFVGDKRGFNLLKHLGKYSTVIFEKNRIKKIIKRSSNGVIYRLNSLTDIVKVDIDDDFERLIKDIKDSKVIFVGENHPLYSNHINQLKIIKAIYKNSKNIAIGMEMFQRPYQKYLDMFIEGKISEKEMLKKSEYYKRWKYDYNLYRPIIVFAKKNHIKLVALNLKTEIVKKVSHNGIDSLNEKEKKHLPNSIDFTNLEYKRYIKDIFLGHKKGAIKNFENFYYAQLLWDETMAQSIVSFLKDKKDYKMIVLAGNGHLRFGYGIPDRVKRRGIKNYKIVLQNDRLEKNIADYILYPPHIDLPKTKRLGVYIDEKNLIIDKVLKDSIAKKIGLKKGDKILKLGKKRLKDLADLKIELLFLKKCSTITIKRDDKILVKKICFEE